MAANLFYYSVAVTRACSHLYHFNLSQEKCVGPGQFPYPVTSPPSLSFSIFSYPFVLAAHIFSCR